MNSTARLLVVLGALALVSCATNAPPATLPALQSALYEWNDDGGPGSLKIRINLNAQRAYFTRGGRPVGWSYVATGRPGHDTPVGSFRVTEKLVDKNSNRYGKIVNELGQTIDHDASPGDPVPAGGRYVGAPMPYWMRLTGYGIGMHGGNIPQPGQPASHGCIRLPKPLAPKLYHAVVVGTPVTIERGPSVPYGAHPPAESFAHLRNDGSLKMRDDGSGRPLYDVGPDGTLRRDGLRVVSPDNPWIVRPSGQPRNPSSR